MKVLNVFLVLIFCFVLTSTSCSKENVNVEEGIEAYSIENYADWLDRGKGNKAPSGAHYNLNIIGMKKAKDAEMLDDNGHRIFVNLEGKTKILLQKGEDFNVLDANGTDGRASFQLPNPDPDNDGKTVYSIYVRPVGTPGGSAGITTCANDPITGEDICSNRSYVVLRNKGGSKFTDISSEVLYIYADLDLDGVEERYPLFDERLQDYLWEYDNNGLKVLQVRFYYN